MPKNTTVAVFGATGQVGSHFVQKAIEQGYSLQVLVRDQNKFAHSGNPNVKVFVGSATNRMNVEEVVHGADVVVSLLGNVGDATIMYEAHNAILDSAKKQETRPRCVMISSIGFGGTSWLIKQLLRYKFIGKAGCDDYEKADKRVREEKVVPFVLVRPTALTDKDGKGTYKTFKKPKGGAFLKPIPRADVAKFFLDAVEETKWDGNPGVLLGAK